MKVLEKPAWMRKKIVWADLQTVSQLKKRLNLNSVCQSAACPNRSECWGRSVATFMILGNTCTRNCGFCNINFGRPDPIDLDEPRHVAQAVQELKLKHVVITSVARDELPDQGSNQFRDTIQAIRQLNQNTSIEVLVPDFRGKKNLIRTVIDEKPEIFNHNVETVERLTDHVRFKATYQQSLDVLSYAKQRQPEIFIKSGIMLGLGETVKEVEQTLIDLKSSGCDLVTIGQYLPPTPNHLKLERYVDLEEFDHYQKFGHEIGLIHVASSPYVRSSYNADQIYQLIQEK